MNRTKTSHFSVFVRFKYWFLFLAVKRPRNKTVITEKKSSKMYINRTPSITTRYYYREVVLGIAQTAHVHDYYYYYFNAIVIGHVCVV